MDESDDEVEEEKVPIPPPPPPPPPAVAPVKPTYIVEAACKRFEIPQEAVLFSAYRVVPVKDGALMGSITASNSPGVWTAAGVSWKNLVRIGWTIDDTLFEGLFVTFSSEANPNSSDNRFLRRITTAPTKQFVSELANLGEKASIKYKNLIEYSIDSPKLDPVAARFRQLSREESELLSVAFRSKPKASPAVAKKPPAVAPVPEPSDEDAPTTTNGKRTLTNTTVSLNIDSHCLIPREMFEALMRDSYALKKFKGRSE